MIKQYIVRVELHSATEPDYERLHAEMGRRGFSRNINDDAGNTYQLPTAEYYLAGNTDLSAVHAAAEQAAQATGRGSWIISTLMSSARFNLQPVRTLLRR